MKLKKNYSFSDKNQVWRILLSDTEKLIIETRDTDEKEAYFHALDLFKGKKIFSKYQLSEKYWVSIEAIYKDIIFFHKFLKPDMPGHKQIIAFDINTQKILWESDSYIFMFLNDKGVYVHEKNMTGNKYFILDHETGGIIENMELEEEEILDLGYDASKLKDYSHYLFPEKYSTNDPEVLSENTQKMISEEIKGLEIVGSVEYVDYGKLLFFNYHNRVFENSLVNRFKVLGVNSGKVIFDMVLNSNVNAYVPDSFFIYKNLLLLLKEKKEVVVFNIAE